MTMRVHELHPALSHYPVALLPLSVGCDICGTILDNEALLTVGRLTMPMAAAAATVTAAAGLVAQEEVNFNERGYEMLKTHRNLNVGALGVTAAMTAYRVGKKKPGLGYLMAGLGSVGVLAYSAYLGGAMVYQEGVGVEQAGGVRKEEDPKIRAQNAVGILRTVGRQLTVGLKHTLEGLIPNRERVLPDTQELKEELNAELGRETENPAPFGP